MSHQQWKGALYTAAAVAFYFSKKDGALSQKRYGFSCILPPAAMVVDFYYYHYLRPKKRPVSYHLCIVS